MEFVEERYTSKIKIYYTSEVNKDFCRKVVDYFWLDKEFLNESIELVRAVNLRGIKVFRLNYKGKLCYLKKHSYTRIGKKIQNSILRKPEGIRNLKNANKLLQAGIVTPKPIFSSVRRNLIFFDSIFFTEEAKGIELDEYIKHNNLSGNQRILKELGRFWAKFIGNNFAHQDPGLDNIFIDISKKSVKLTLIDLDDIYSLLFLPKKVAVHILARFIAKTYICLFKYNQDLLKKDDLSLFFREFLEKCSKNFNFKNFIEDVDKLIIKKIIRRDWKEVIPVSDVLAVNYEKYNFS